jgi:NMD protein affecting ribosome stability and mRNA decay
MKSLPCPRCGASDVIDTLCANCERELNPLVEKFKEHAINICVKSSMIKLQTAWERISLEEAYEKTIKKTVIPSPGSEITGFEYEIPEIEYIDKPGMDKLIDLPVVITGVRNKVQRTEEYDVPIRIKTTVSGKYAKIGTQYYEGTLQLRNEKPFHIKELKKHFARNPDLASNKTTVVSTGHDYQITDKQRMRQIAHKLQHRFGGLLKENARLVTRDKQKSKDVYRLTILIEFPPYEQGDVLTDGKRLLKVKGFGKKIQYQNVITGKKVEEPYAQLDTVQKHKTKITQTHPELAIINPETFQQIFVKSREEHQQNENVTVVQFKNVWYVV